MIAVMELRDEVTLEKHTSYPDEVIEVDRLITVRVDLSSMYKQK